MVSLAVHNSYRHDFSPIARVDHKIMESIGAVEGDVLEVAGKRKTVARCKLLGKREAADNLDTIGLQKLYKTMQKSG